MYNSELCTCVVISVHPGSNGAVTSAMLLQCLLIWARFHLPSSDAFLILLLSAICSFSQTLQGASFLQFAVCPWLGHYLGRGFRRRGESLPQKQECSVTLICWENHWTVEEDGFLCKDYVCFCSWDARVIDLIQKEFFLKIYFSCQFALQCVAYTCKLRDLPKWGHKTTIYDILFIS